jgi:hypothetical protein
MQSTHHSPAERWNSVAGFYTRLSENAAWGHLATMTDLCRWAGEQGFAGDLFPGTSLDSLCVQRSPGYNPDQPFFSCKCTPDSKFEFQLWAKVGHQLKRSQVELAELQAEFANYAEQLLHDSSPHN